MDWNKLNFDEIGFFCKSSKSQTEIDCLPFSSQLALFCGILFYYGIERFCTEDIQGVFAVLKLKSARTGKINLPTYAKIHSALEKLTKRGILSDREEFYISNEPFESVIYKEAIKAGHEKGSILDWVAFAEKNGEVCERNISG